jgi:hypothetical protein
LTGSAGRATRHGQKRVCRAREVSTRSGLKYRGRGKPGGLTGGFFGARAAPSFASPGGASGVTHVSASMLLARSRRLARPRETAALCECLLDASSVANHCGRRNAGLTCGVSLCGPLLELRFRGALTVSVSGPKSETARSLRQLLDDPDELVAAVALFPRVAQ